MKAIISSNNFTFSDKLSKIKIDDHEVNIIGVFPIGLPTMQAIQDHNPMFVLIEPNIAYELNEAKLTTTTATPRCYISANTHHGIQLLPVSAVYFFQAEHKYVVAHHAKGELLINDALISLEQEFASVFIRIHRKTLVAKEYIEALEKTEDGRWQIVLTNYPKKLIVSRRQLTIVRKCINENSAMNKRSKG